MEDEFDDAQRFRLGENLNRIDSRSTLNLHGEENEENSEEEEESLDNPDLYFGDVAKDKFWDFYKSERKFKDFTHQKKDIEDPRQAYF